MTQSRSGGLVLMIQTWLPYPDFRKSAECLDMPELALQRLNVLELMEYYHDIEQDSSLPESYQTHDLDDHSIVKMWNGFQLQLCEYGLVCCDEYSVRKSKPDPIYEAIRFHLECATTEDAPFRKPNWFGDPDFHMSHQAELLRLNPDYYASYFKVDTERELIWPKSDYVAPE